LKLLNKTSSVTPHSQAALLIYFFLVFAGLCNGAFAQSASDTDQIHSPVVKSTTPGKTPDSNIDSRSSSESRKLSVFFMIGITINIVMLLLFAVWFVSQWKKQNEQ